MDHQHTTVTDTGGRHADQPDGPEADPTYGRRALLRRGGLAAAAAAAGAAAATIGQAGPAAAANGDNLILGQGNSQSQQCSISHSGTGYSAFMVTEPQLIAAPPMKALVAGYAAGTFEAGVMGRSSTSAGAGVAGYGYGTAAGLHAEVTGGGPGVRVVTSAAHLELVPSGVPAPNRQGTFAKGSLLEDTNGDLWLCVAAGLPGTWRKLAGPTTTGAQHLLAAPVRVFDSRAGFAPLNVAKGAFVNQTKTIDAKNNASGVPAGATAALVTLSVTGTNSGGYGALWAQGASPGTANISWSAAGTTLSNTVLTGLKADGTFQCQIAGTADVIIDVIAYHR